MNKIENELKEQIILNNNEKEELKNQTKKYKMK